METLSTKIPGVWYKRLCTFLLYDIVYCISFGILLIFKDMFTSPPKADIEKIGKRTGQVAVITGGPRGLALGLIKRLVELDYKIIMGVRNVEDGKKRLSKFANSNGNLSFKNIKMFEMDLMSLNSIRKFAANVLKETSRIDLLLCNAAIMRAPFELTCDGYESQFQVNYLGNFLLTHLLLERLKDTSEMKNQPCHVINTSSAYYMVGKFRPNELEKPEVYTPYKFYFPSKLYGVMAMLHLQRKLDQENIQVFCYSVHPGVIPTDIWFQAAGYFAIILKAFSRIFRSLENGADTILWPVLSTEYLHKRGLYLESGASVEICDHAKDKEAQRMLYEKSLQLAGLKN